jgi:D-3-phosphoglycerate dehydrogenase
MTDELKKRVLRFDFWVDPAFDSILSTAPDVELAVCAMNAAPDDALRRLAQAHVYHVTAAKDEIPTRWFASPELLDACPNLLAVSSTGAGYDTIDVAACTARGIAVMNQAGGNADSVAEMTLGLILALYRRIPESDRALRTRRGFSREDLMGAQVHGRTIGLIGIGHVGTIVARLARAFGLRVVAYDPYLTAADIFHRGAEPASLRELLTQSDIVSLHCPRNAETLRMFDAARFAAMKPGAYFVSTARGGIHDEAALADALACGHLGGAGLDVWDPEPPPLSHPLLQFDNVVATFHTAGVSREARRNMAALAATQILELLSGQQRPSRLVNPEVWERCAARIGAAFHTAKNKATDE